MPTVGAWILISLMGIAGLVLLIIGLIGVWTWVKELWPTSEDDEEPST